MPLGMELEYRLRYMDFDRYGRMKPEALLDMFQDVATMQAEDMGIGAAEMHERGVLWVVVRMKYEVVRAPVRFQRVRVRTWPHSPTRFSFQRDFSVLDDDGELLVKASSEWVLMDARTRKFASMKDHYDPSWHLDDARSFPGEKLRKVASFGIPEDAEPAHVVVPAYSDIDANGHVNNARYAGFALDALRPGPEGAVRVFQIDYRHEVLVGAPLSVYTHVEGQRVRAMGVNGAGEVAFACQADL